MPAPGDGITLDVVVLAGGRSRRMGRDKAMLPVDGHRLVDVVAERMATVASRVLVASGRRSLGRHDEVTDPEGYTGPIGGILAGLRRSDADLIGVVPVDAPGTDPRVLVRLAALCQQHHRAAAVVTSDGHLQALHAVFAGSARPAIEQHLEGHRRSPRALLGWLDALVVDVDGWGDLDPAGALADDWDHPGDLPWPLPPGWPPSTGG